MTGIIVSIPPTPELPPGQTSGGTSVLPGVTYGFALLSLPQTWTAKQTFPLGNISINGADVTGTLSASLLPFSQPVSYPSVITSGHNVAFTDSDVQFGNSYSQYPFGSVSANSLIIGKSGCTIGSSTVGQIFTIVFTSAGLTGSPITKTYTAVGGDTPATIATALAALVNGDTILHGLGGKPIFMQPLGAGVFNLQYDAALSATGATPLTTATTGSTGTINLVAETNALDYILLQLGRAIPVARPGRVGDGLYALDFTGQDSTGTFNTHYGQITISIASPTAGATRGQMTFLTAGGAESHFNKGMAFYDTSGVIASGGPLGLGSINIPAVGKYSIDNVNNIRRNSGAGQFIFEATNTDNIIFSTSGGGIGINATPTGVTLTSGLGAFVSGAQVPTTGSGISIAGGATPVLSARNYGTATALPLQLSASSVALSAAGVLTPLVFANATSGTITLQPVTGALGAQTLSLPATTGTLVTQGTGGPSAVLLGFAKNIDLNSIADTAVALTIPVGTTYRIQAAFVYNHGTTASLTTARAGVFSAAGGGGSALFSDQALSGATSNAVNTNGAMVQLTANLSTAALNFTSVFFRVGTGQGAAATGDFYLYGFIMP